jgi:dinuclear metal center YbgI/SA1388 family protein
MTTVAEIARWLEQFAPSRLAEDWDNVGLLWGDPAVEVTKVMTCLTVTRPTACEAIDEHAGLIISHHPVLFRALKRIRADLPETGFLWDLARAGVAVASPHTAFDNTRDGINDGLARRLGLLDIRPLRSSPSPDQYKIVVFAPRSDRAAVLDAAFAAGSGRIGAYDECSFTGAGFGTFFGGAGTNPTVGQAGRRETARELRIEILCPSDRLAATVAAIRAAHSYEEPAIDVYPLRSPGSGQGAGRLGRLPQATTLAGVARLVAETLPTQGIQIVGDPHRRVERIAIACGAGDDFLAIAAQAQADALLTGEARFHRALEAQARGIGLVLAGHYATERPGVEDLAVQLGSAFPSLTVWASRYEDDPFQPVVAEQNRGG